jgi:hypothetical protein
VRRSAVQQLPGRGHTQAWQWGAQPSTQQREAHGSRPVAPTPIPDSAPPPAAPVPCRCNPTSISLKAGCELFLRYTTRTSALEMEDFAAAKARLIEVRRGCWGSRAGCRQQGEGLIEAWGVWQQQGRSAVGGKAGG